MDELKALESLAEAVGVHTHYTDGLGDPVTVAPETLLRVCTALGAPVASPSDAAEALRAHETRDTGLLPPVLVAWDGAMAPISISEDGPVHAEMILEDGGSAPLEIADAVDVGFRLH